MRLCNACFDEYTLNLGYKPNEDGPWPDWQPCASCRERPRLARSLSEREVPDDG